MTKKDGRGHGPGSRATRIKPGEVRNPKGRPKGATGVRADIIREYKRKVSIVENGRSIELPMGRLMVRAGYNQATKDPKFFMMMFDQLNRIETEDRVKAERDKKDQEIQELIKIYKQHNKI